MLRVKPGSERDTAPTGDREVTIIVLAKLPIAGRAKTRMCPPCSPVQAADIAEAALFDTLTAVSCARTQQPSLVGRVVVCLERLGIEPPPWITDAGRVIDQCEGDLNDRLAHAFASVSGPAILIAMDTPQVTVELLVEAASTLLDPKRDSLIGLSTDGGFWIIGFRACPPDVFRDVSMSTDHTGNDQLRAMTDSGLQPKLLPVLSDFDTFDDVLAIAECHTGLRTATAVRLVADQIRTNETTRAEGTDNVNKHRTEHQTVRSGRQ